MSLINQMLKDLESRRAESVASPDSPLKGVNRYNVAQRRPAYLFYGLGALLLILAALVGFLGWAYLNPPQHADAATPPVAVEMSPTTEEQPASANETPAVKASPQKAAPEPGPEPESVVSAKPPSSPEPARQQQAEATVAEQPATTGSRQREEAGEDDASVNKRSRPLSDEQRAELAYKKGYQLLGREQLEAGERQLRDALTHYPRHHGARELLASVYIKRGRYVEAGSLLKEGLALAPGHTLFAKLYARVLLKQQKPARAIAILERQPPMPGVDSEYHALLAALYQQTGQHLKAAASYRDILRVNPHQGNGWIGLGISLEKLEKYAEARSAYQRAKNSTNLTENLRQYVDKRLAVLADAGH
ncbi:tetratricopeptide repeat protein [Thiohalophilus sp.]|uniref:tetratricopeptide repeat protein n=1 Tax=Thiohalophilus sp. TaxID=3028392 RepID=UPI002ACECBF3|nr:tetratricopeptide repeat protein [Thiohalophilus sp.]MDZ7661741.1 tetratricopeptide repeat protein [Thiohalophilus sp.]